MTQRPCIERRTHSMWSGAVSPAAAFVLSDCFYLAPDRLLIAREKPQPGSADAALASAVFVTATRKCRGPTAGSALPLPLRSQCRTSVKATEQADRPRVGWARLTRLRG